MTPVQIIYLVGICVFGLGMLVNTVIGIIYFGKSNHLVERLDKSIFYKSHWRKTLWIYGVLFLNFFLFLMLYVAQYFGQGIFQNLSLVYVLWGRWLMWLPISYVNSYCLTYIMTHKSKDIQSMVHVLANFLAYLFFLFAAVSQLMENRFSWITGSAFIFIVGILAYIFPFNKWRVDDGRYHQDIVGQSWGGYYHRAFYILYIVVYVIYFITWVLSPVNGYTNMTTETESIIYLITDALPLIIFTIYIWVSTHSYMHQYLYVDCAQPQYRAMSPKNK